MRYPLAALMIVLSGPVWACAQAVCRVDPDSLMLTQVITFDGVPSGGGPGYNIDGLLPLPGAAFGEHFAGQTVQSRGSHDAVEGVPLKPLTLLPGPAGQNLSVVASYGNVYLNGYGAAGFPRRDGQGEGAIAVQFDEDQSALSFDLRGGEAGTALVQFLRRDGSIIAALPVAPTGEFTVGFLRGGGAADIAGVVVTNTDPQGMAIDTLRFGKPPDVS